MTAGMVAGLLAVTAMAAAFIGVSQYRGVMGPLRRLQLAVGRAAGADFEHVSESGDQEFSDLARRFNRMADELAELYRSLEQKVETKSRELVRSERLASVGYLAAGVAHEINNPIGIIGGYAEAALKSLEAGGQGDERTLKALRVITEEAFRCKEITEKLLSLAAPGEPAHQRIDLIDLVRSVVELLRDHKPFAGRELQIVEEGPAPYRVKANATEIRQVLLNLVTNALESVEPPDGRVIVYLLRGPDDVLVTVEDNGRGMSGETLTKVFEPFFTDKPARDRRGMGLGLSVSHAIVEAHGGRLTVQSAGVGCGSRFVLELPSDEEGSIDVASR